MAAVWIPDEAEANQVRAGIRNLRQNLNLRSNYEFKFCQTYHMLEWRKAFFDVVLGHGFYFAVSNIDKTHPDWLGASRKDQHWACATELAALMRPLYCRSERHAGDRLKERIVVDDNRDREFLRIIQDQFRGLRSVTNSTDSMIGKVSFRKSAPDEMLQVVDMICGAVGGFLDQLDTTWYEPIAGRDMANIWLPLTLEGHSDRI